MIEIRNFQFSPAGSTFDVDLNGEIITGCRTTEDRGRTKVLFPQSAADAEWDAHTISDIEAAVVAIVKI